MKFLIWYVIVLCGLGIFLRSVYLADSKYPRTQIYSSWNDVISLLEYAGILAFCIFTLLRNQ